MQMAHFHAKQKESSLGIEFSLGFCVLPKSSLVKSPSFYYNFENAGKA